MMVSRSSLLVRLARMMQRIPLWVFRFCEWPFVVFFGRGLTVTPAVIVFALPRSGSTVTYQAICHGLSVNYLSNFWHLFYQLPLFGGLLSAIIIKAHYSGFNSQHGFVPGLDGPAEGLRFWQWWLDCGLTDRDCQRLSAAKRAKRAFYLRRVISILGGRGKPFATTYLGHALVPDRVNEAFPGAVLIRLKREPVSNALSLLRSMRSFNSKWFSVKPLECDGMESATEHERVAAQVYWLNRRLDDATCAKTMLTVHYEMLCSNPESEIERVRQWCHYKGVSIDSKFAFPANFSYESADIYGDPDAIIINEAIYKLEVQYGKLKEVI
jgi:hypothetical protein